MYTIFIPSSLDLMMSILQPDRFLTLRKVYRIGIHPLCLRDKQECHDCAHDTTGEENPEGVRNTNLSRSAKVIKEDAGQDSAHLSSCSTDAMCEATHAGWIRFARDDEGGGIGPKVEEELKWRSQKFALCIWKRSDLIRTCAIVKQTNLPAVPRCA